MKKLLILSLVALWVSVANAQYFTNTYNVGLNTAASVASGFNTSTTGSGYIITGSVLNTNNLPVVARSNVSGTTTFKKIYTMTLSGSTIQSKVNTEVFELSNGTAYGVVGRGDASAGGFFYFNIDLTGAPTGVAKLYTSASTGLTTLDGLVSDGTNFYVVGSDNNDMIIAKIQISTGNVSWSGIYHSVAGNLLPKDIILDPYNSGNLVVCGVLDYGGGSTDGFTVTINGSTGAAGSLINYGTVLTSEGFYAIKPMSNTIGGSNGFILAGYAPGTSNTDMWIMALNSNFSSILSSKTVDYSTGAANQAYDIIERLNNSSQYEYYMTGYVNNSGSGTGNNAMTVKLNNLLNVVTNGQFTSTTNDQIAYKLDQYNGTLNDGLTIFSTEEPTPSPFEFNITRVYFNGTASCGISLANTTANTYSATKGTNTVSKTGSFSGTNISVSASNISETQVCFSSTIPGGSNAKVFDPKKNELLLSPNPARTNETIDIKLLDNELEGIGTVTVSIFDMEGRQCYEMAQAVQSNNNNLSINLVDANLKDGLYFVTISGQSVQKHVMLRVVR